MNDTNLTPRQEYILNLINQSGGLSREKIQDKIKSIYPSSKPTLIRDLNNLLRAKFISIKGKAKVTTYHPFNDNPLLRVFDLDKYFLYEPDKRIDARKTFDFKIFKLLSKLFTGTELKTLQSVAKSFNKKTTDLPSDILKRELERFIIELSWKSSKIEGNTYTLLETESLIKEQREAKGRTKEETVMILNHKSAFEEILKNKDSFKTLSFSTINQLHNILTKNLSITPGIRKRPVGITGTVYRPLDNEFQIKEAFEKTIEIINKNDSPFEKTLIAHFMVPYIQPYSDGNKRTGRMLTNAILLANDLYPLTYRSVDEEEFKKSLILFYEQLSIFHIKRLFINQFKFANENYFK